MSIYSRPQESVIFANTSLDVVYRQLRDLWTKGQKENIAPTNAELLQATIPLLETLSRFDQPCYSLIDMIEQRYLFLSPNQGLLTGYPIQAGYDGGMEWVFGIIHPEDLGALLEINRVKWEFFRALPEIKRPDFRANFDFRIRHQKGYYKRLVQQSICLEHTQEGYPKIILAKLHDITNLKLPELREQLKPSLLLTINTGGQDEVSMQCSPGLSTIWKRPLLSRREFELLALLDQGLTSKEIACQLGNSTATISTQRRNMIRKTGVVDTTALVSYSKLLGWI